MELPKDAKLCIVSVKTGLDPMGRNSYEVEYYVSSNMKDLGSKNFMNRPVYYGVLTVPMEDLEYFDMNLNEDILGEGMDIMNQVTKFAQKLVLDSLNNKVLPMG